MSSNNLRRKVKCLDGEIQSFIIKGERNSCNCGSNCFHKVDDSVATIGVCNACGKDIYIFEKHEKFKDWKWVDETSLEDRKK